MTETEDAPDKAYIYVVWWLYHDRSGVGFIKAFDYERDAENFKDLLDKHGDPGKNYACTKVEQEAPAY